MMCQTLELEWVHPYLNQKQKQKQNFREDCLLQGKGRRLLSEERETDAGQVDMHWINTNFGDQGWKQCVTKSTCCTLQAQFQLFFVSIAKIHPEIIWLFSWDIPARESEDLIFLYLSVHFFDKFSFLELENNLMLLWEAHRWEVVIGSFGPLDSREFSFELYGSCEHL